MQSVCDSFSRLLTGGACEQVIADLYERYVELIGTVKDDGEAMTDGYVDNQS
jgi:DNA-directed RNA polymerase subunit N (RpoN/RPB10)